MNCKPGDLAVVIKSISGNEGRIVRVVRLHHSTTHDIDGYRVYPENDGPRWVLEKPVRALSPQGHELPLFTVPDSCLRPIRDPGDDARDELLRPLPHEVCA